MEGNYKNILDKADIVTFDIFDTLLVRNTVEPRDIFMIVREMFNQNTTYCLSSDFVNMRIDAEIIARRQLYKKVDVTLDEIYDTLEKHFGYPQKICDSLKETELEAEYNNIVLNESVAGLYEYAKSTGKKIAILSDMYLPKSFIKKLLSKYNILYDYLLLSSDDNVAKSTASMFARFVGSVGLNKKIVHIGDNESSDVSWPNKFNIETIHIHKNIEEASFETDDKLRAIYGGFRYRYTKNKKYLNIDDVQFNIISGLSVNYAIKKDVNCNMAIGYSIFGPVLLSFVQWLHSLAVSKNIDCLYFMARDGAIMRHAYNLFFDKLAINNIYMFGSRRLISFPAILYQDFSANGVQSLIGCREVYVNDTLKCYGIDVSSKKVNDILERVGLKLSSAVYPGETADRFKAALLLLQNDILKQASSEVKLLNSYFASINLNKDISPMVVDVGWNGSMQESISYILGKEINGAYFGISNSMKSRRLGNLMSGYFDMRSIDRERTEEFLSGGILIVESLFTNPNQGSIIGIKKKDGKFVAIEDSYDKNEDERAMIEDMHKGALQFIDDIKKLKLPRSLYTLTKSAAFRAFDLVINDPNDVVALKFGRIHHSDVASSKPEYIGSPINWNKSNYRHNSKLLKKEYEKAIWKTGFIKNCETIGVKDILKK